MKAYLLLALCWPLAAQGVAYTFNASGLLTLSHNGQSYLGATGGPVLFAGYFGPSNTLVNYTTTATSLQAGGWTIRYNNGIAGDTSFVVEPAGVGTDVFEYELCITNNDTLSRTLNGFNIDKIFSLSFPSTPTVTSDTQNNYIGWRSYGAVTMFSYTAGSMACYLDTYLQMEFLCFNGKSLMNISSLYGTEASIAAGATKCTTLKMKWGVAGASITDLGRDGYTTFRTERPQTYQFPNRNIAAYMIIADGTKTATNPRGYQVSSGTPDWFGNFAATRTTFLSKMATYIGNAASVVPKPPFLVLWDIEGQEFNHVFTYVGYPGDTDRGSNLQYLAPEMEVETNGVPLADEVFALIRASGMEPALTIRPSTFQVGTGGPTNECLSQGPFEGDSYVDYSSTSYSQRGYECQEVNVTSYNDSTDTVSASSYPTGVQFRNNITVRFYAASGGVLPAGIVSGTSYGMCNIDDTAKTFQVGTDLTCGTLITDFSGSSGTTYFEYWKGPRNISVQALVGYQDGVALLRKKINYAINRWGIRAFYVDSSYFSTSPVGAGTGSVVIHNQAWVDLFAEFPSIIFMPENSLGGGYTGKFGDFLIGNYGRNTQTVRLYPEYATYLKVDGSGYDANRATIRAGIASGVPYLLNVQTPPTTGNALKLVQDYALAKTTNATVSMTNSANDSPRIFQANPGDCLSYQCVMRAYFADTANNLAASTTYCTRMATDACYLSGVLQSTASLNLAALPYYQLAYYDFAGNLVSRGPSAQLQ